MTQSAIPNPQSAITLEALQTALQKTGNQCITIYRSGTSRLIGGGSASFRSLPELSHFVAAVNGAFPLPKGEGQGEGEEPPEVLPSTIPPARVNRQSSIVNPSCPPKPTDV